jgi:hypothetical protein
MYSREYVQDKILKLSDDEIEEIKKQNDASPPEVSPPDYSPLEGEPPAEVQQQNQGQDDGQQ